MTIVTRFTYVRASTCFGSFSSFYSNMVGEYTVAVAGPRLNRGALFLGAIYVAIRERGGNTRRIFMRVVFYGCTCARTSEEA